MLLPTYTFILYEQSYMCLYEYMYICIYLYQYSVLLYVYMSTHACIHTYIRNTHMHMHAHVLKLNCHFLIKHLNSPSTS